MSDNEPVEETPKNTIDGFKVFIKARYCFPLNEGEQAIYDSYDDEEKTMINTVINKLSERNELDDLIKEIIEEEERKNKNNETKTK